MVRPMTELGAYGKIKTRETPPGSGTWEARTRIRDKSGRLRQVRRSGKSSNAAEAALKKKLNALAREIHSGKITSSTRFETVAWKWHAEFREKAVAGGKSPTSVRLYKGYLTNDILPRCGALTMDEVTPGVLDGIIKAVHREKSSAAAKSVKSVLGGVGRYAVVHGLWDVNRGHQVDEIIEDAPKDVAAFDPAELIALRPKVAEAAAARTVDKRDRPLGLRATTWRHVPDVLDVIAATGARLGEVLGMDKTAFRRDGRGRPVVDIYAHVIRGLDGRRDRVAYRKNSKNRLTLVVPEWSVPMFSRLTMAAAAGGPLFPSMRGEWLHPDDMSDKITAVLKDAGAPGMTAKVLRATVGDALDDAGHSIDDIAAQLGNTARVARKHYTRSRARNEKQAQTLEVFGGGKAPSETG